MRKPCFTRWPNASTARVAVDPVPKPSTIPSSTSATAASAAACLNCWSGSIGSIADGEALLGVAPLFHFVHQRYGVVFRRNRAVALVVRHQRVFAQTELPGPFARLNHHGR